MVVYNTDVVQPNGSITIKKGTVIVRTRITKLQKAREESGLTQVEVAKKAKVTVVCYQRYEYGHRIPRADTAKLIAQALDSSVEELF